SQERRPHHGVAFDADHQGLLRLRGCAGRGTIDHVRFARQGDRDVQPFEQMTDFDDTSPATARSLRAMERAQAVSRALTDAARRARFSSRARGAYSGGSFAARRGAKVIRALTIALFVLAVAVPNLVSIVYFGLLASDQFVSEAKFTISSAAIPKMD